jgi:5-hydroxyisourate hydrolase / 2-oxo-4-hydroxy-4-carboxy-5-ureidoimidazoline decarboxylase
MTIPQLNTLPKEKVAESLTACCGSEAWVNKLMEHFPFGDEMQLVKIATEIWYNACSQKDWLEAFSHHPKIGDVESLQKKFVSTSHLAGEEQAGVNEATGEVINKLATANKDYEQKFGFIFIICATGKSAAEMLRLLTDRLQNTHDEELAIAMGEQQKITIIRLQKLLNGANWKLPVSQITTHILDTSLGIPAKNITIKLQHQIDGSWKSFSQGVTNADGRVADLLPPAKILEGGYYKMVFEIGNYFDLQNIQSFYPLAEIIFSIRDDKHYHVPLLLNPFGYSTYRGS